MIIKDEKQKIFSANKQPISFFLFFLFFFLFSFYFFFFCLFLFFFSLSSSILFGVLHLLQGHVPLLPLRLLYLWDDTVGNYVKLEEKKRVKTIAHFLTFQLTSFSLFIQTSLIETLIGITFSTNFSSSNFEPRTTMNHDHCTLTISLSFTIALFLRFSSFSSSILISLTKTLVEIAITTIIPTVISSSSHHLQAFHPQILSFKQCLDYCSQSPLSLF